MNNNSYALVTVRMSSTRLPEKCLQPIVDNLSLIQVVIRRAKMLGCPVVLTTTNDSSDDQLVDIARQEKVDFFRGALNNKIKRWADCFQKYNISEALLVDGDDPTFDYNVGARALALLQEGQGEIIMSDTELTPGFFTYGITQNGIAKLSKIAPDPMTNTDVITVYIQQAKLRQCFVPPLENESLGHNLRLTVDYPEDLEFYRVLYAKANYLSPGPEIVKVALANNFQKINWHRHEDFLKNQNEFNRQVKSDLQMRGELT